MQEDYSKTLKPSSQPSSKMNITRWIVVLVVAALCVLSVLSLIDSTHDNDSAFERCDDLTIVTELSTYDPNSDDIKSQVTDIAIRSWLLNTKNVVVLVESEGLCSGIKRKFPELTCVVHRCNHHDHKIPVVSCLMMTGDYNTNTDFILFTNGDISFSPLRSVITKVSQEIPNFILAGQRIDIHTSKAMGGNLTTVRSILSLALKEGELHGESAIDYFIYPKRLSVAQQMPPFLLGNWKWDNWLLHDHIISDRATVVDATHDIHAVHVGATAKSLNQRPGAVYNSRIFDSSTFGMQGVGMGTFRYADAVLKNGHIVRNNDITIATTKFIFGLAKTSETLVVVTVPCGFTAQLQNWVSWADRAGLRSFIVFPMDSAAAAFAREQKLPLPPLTHRLLDPSSSECQSVKHTERLLVERNYLLRNISQAGLGFVSLSVNTLLLEPFRVTSVRNKEIYGQRLSANSTPTEISDGMWGVSAAFSKGGAKLLRSVVACQESILEKIPDQHEVTVKSLRSEPYCVRNIAAACLNSEIKKNYAGSLTVLSESFVASGHSIFELQRPQRRGLYPAVLHQDLLCGADEGMALLKQWNFVLQQERFDVVMPQSRLNEALQYVHHTHGHAALAIRVLTMNRPEQLANALASLQNADYEGDRVDVEIHIDYPPKPIASNLRLYNAVQEVAKSFQWKHGVLKVVDPGTHRGLFDMWAQPFEPQVDGQVLMVLEDDNELSPVFYQWFKALLGHLSNSEDPRLYGFSLQRQHSIIGLRADQKYPTSFIDLRMDPNRLFYRYQLLSSWGTVLFPSHWNAFVRWATSIRKSQPDFQPCVPFLFNNIWYLNKPTHIWTIWFNYYIYMHGLYSMYVNYARYDVDGRYFSLLKNHRANGLHFKSKPKTKRKPDMQDLLEFLMEPAPKMFLPPASYPLYDFYLQSVGDAQLLGDRWRFMSGIGDKCQVNHPNMLDQ